MEITKVKNLLRITTDKHDTYLNEVIPLFVEKINKRANQTFTELPLDLQHTLAKWIEWDMNTKQGLEARTLGDVSYKYDNNMPDFVKRDIAPYRKVRF